MTVLEANQAEIRAGDAAALVVGPGTSYQWVAGGPRWWAAPELRTSDQERANTDGYVAGRDLLGRHVTTLQVTLLGDDQADLATKIAAWKQACARSSDSLVALRTSFLGQTRVRYGRFRIPGEVDAALALIGNVAVGSAQFEVLDARTYGDDEYQAMTGRELPGTGFSPPFEVPFTLGASVSGFVDLVNAGDLATRWTARADGPFTNLEIRHTDLDRRLRLNANGGVDLAAGDWLDFSSDDESILLNGVADRRVHLSLDSRWFQLEPGSNDIQVVADAGGGTVTFTWRSAYTS